MQLPPLDACYNAMHIYLLGNFSFNDKLLGRSMCVILFVHNNQGSNLSGREYWEMQIWVSSAWVEFDEFYLFVENAWLWVHVLTHVTGRVDCFRCVCALQTLR